MNSLSVTCNYFPSFRSEGKEKNRLSLVFLGALRKWRWLSGGSPSVTYLQDFPCDKLLTSFALHTKEPLVVLFTVWGAIPARQKCVQLLQEVTRATDGGGHRHHLSLSPLHRMGVELTRTCLCLTQLARVWRPGQT